MDTGNSSATGAESQGARSSGGLGARISELKGLVSEDLTSPPEIDLREDYRVFAQGLKTIDEDERATMLEGHVEAIVQARLDPWLDSVAKKARLRTDIFGFQKQLQSQQAELDTEASTAKAEISAYKDQMALLVGDIEEDEANLAHVKTPGRFDRLTLIMVLVGVLLLTLGTFYYFLHTQGSIIVARAGGAEAYFGSGVEKFSVPAFLQASPTNIIYCFGAVVFVLAGKLVAMVYTRYGFPRGLFLASVLGSVVLLIGSAVMISFSSTKTFELEQAKSEILALSEPLKLATILAGGDGNPCASDTGSKPAVCEQITAAQDRADALADSVAGLGFWMTILIFLSELLIGSAAWMYVEDFKRKHDTDGGQLGAQIARKKSNLSDVKSRLSEAENVRSSCLEQIQWIKTCQGEVNTLLAKLPTTTTSQTQRQNIMLREKALANAEYLAVRGTWPQT